MRPVVVDLDRNGLDDLIVEGYVLLSQGEGTFVKRDLEPILGEGAVVIDTSISTATATSTC